ncbi:hypothetical protein TNCV_116211 [Trichonephila clavipes]|nr:hypothetical protein TNCV_116211 [Trichonephila clavipes]
MIPPAQKAHQTKIESDCFLYRVLPNSTNKFRGMIVGSMGTANQHRTLGRKPPLVGENHQSYGNHLRTTIWKMDRTRCTCSFASILPATQSIVFILFWRHFKSRVYETLLAAVNDLTACIIVASFHNARTPALFERIRSLSFGVASFLTYATTAYNNSSDNYLSMQF